MTSMTVEQKLYSRNEKAHYPTGFFKFYQISVKILTKTFQVANSASTFYPCIYYYAVPAISYIPMLSR